MAALHAHAAPVRAAMPFAAAVDAAGVVPAMVRVQTVGAHAIAGMRPVEGMPFGAEEGMCVVMMMGFSVLHFQIYRFL
ncbi:hypothetical protein [Stenotrophomonas daejeonensis]|uniref:hypothetical protein n=1 Tax=Stenotrophomonas daejeonensis TaxID=659018 RepID=UPI00128FAB0B|nr:hypothetical protein [Stenotrophomonas daejeonensis]